MNEYSRIDDEVYSFNNYSRVICHTTVTKWTENGADSFYREYKTSGRKECSVVIKRKIDYFLTLEYNYQGQKDSVMIFADMMYELVEKLSYIKNAWFDISNQNVFGVVNNRLVVVNSLETVIISCPHDKILRFCPCVNQKNDRDYPAVVMYIGDLSFPIVLAKEKISGLLWTLTNTNWLNFANTSLSFIGKPDGAYNRVDFSSNNENQLPEEFNDATGKKRDFKCRSKSFFDK